jgi:acyl-CoA thioester hydrolase
MQQHQTETLALTNRSIYPVWSQTTVRYADLDPNNHVNNGAIGAFFEDGRVRLRSEYLDQSGGGTLAGFAIRKTTIEYLRALSFPATVDIGSTIARIGRSSYTLAQAVFVDDQCIATAEIVTVRIDNETGKSVPIEDWIRATLEQVGPRS